MNVEEFIRRPELAMRVVGQRLDDLVYGPDPKGLRTRMPPRRSIKPARDITEPFVWPVEDEA